MTSRFSDLHDGIFVGLELDWAPAECRATIRRHDGDTVLRWRGVTSVQLTQLNPWGPSASVNSLEQVSDSRYVLELQSGDALQVDATELEMVVGRSP